MKTTRIGLAALAVLALTLGVGTVAAAPDGVPARANDGRQAGPPGELPGPVPIFVSDIHSTIGEFLDSVENLGKAVSGLTLGEGDVPAPAQSGDWAVAGRRLTALSGAGARRRGRASRPRWPAARSRQRRRARLRHRVRGRERR
jgi:hypothetical protein